MYKLDINKMQDNKQILKIGELTPNIINILELSQKPRNIKFGYDRISHCQKHLNDFKNIESYNKSMEQIPNIISHPDYISFNTSNSSIEYIKRIDELTLVAIRLKSKGDLFLRSIYPISESKLQNGIRLNRIKKYRETL